jgi:hypothetical protein
VAGGMPVVKMESEPVGRRNPGGGAPRRRERTDYVQLSSDMLCVR